MKDKPMVTDAMIEAGFDAATLLHAVRALPEAYRDELSAIYRAMEAARPLADGGTLARILADHFERRDDAFDKADADAQIRYLSAAVAVRDAVLS